jgi:hypothetical protein
VSLCPFSIRVLAVLTIGSALLLAQEQQPPAPGTPAPAPGTPAPAPTSQTTPAPGTTAAPGTPPTPAPGAETPNPDQAWSIELLYWLTRANPQQRGGAAATDYETVGPIGPSQSAPGIEATLPLTKNDVLQLSFFQMKGRGASIASQAVDVYSTSLPAGFLASQYRVRSAKASFEDFLHPYPNYAAKLRFKTLWEAQYVQVTSRTDAPLDTSTDATTGYVSYPTTTGSHQVFLPTFGVAMQYAVSKRLSLDVRGSAFGIPRHSDLVDSEATAAYQIGPVQIVVGGRFYEFKTSPKSEEYYKASIAGALVGLRWTVRE